LRISDCGLRSESALRERYPQPDPQPDPLNPQSAIRNPQ